MPRSKILNILFVYWIEIKMRILKLKKKLKKLKVKQIFHRIIYIYIYKINFQSLLY